MNAATRTPTRSQPTLERGQPGVAIASSSPPVVTSGPPAKTISSPSTRTAREGDSSSSNCAHPMQMFGLAGAATPMRSPQQTQILKDMTGTLNAARENHRKTC